MGKIFYIMGKSSSGKDSIYRQLEADQELGLRRLVIYTTRPIRDGEENGREYFFVDENKLKEFRRNGKLIEAREYYGDDVMRPVYIEVEDGERLERALARERTQEAPKYEEMCRRFLADQNDFSEENILKAGIWKRFQNHNLDECVKEIGNYIKSVQ